MAPVVDVATEVLLGKADRPFDKLTAEEGFLVELEIFIDMVARTPLGDRIRVQTPRDALGATSRVVARD
jgi:hypothetical protein